ncbi:hypothetical protein CC2G_006460 [Coprinopsis cinerea AmutBmut pab1-1]|nr:hypothetical protein CC2G_006460 [Coprinopsis cinerea AmutBmut pab1-1]
MGSWWKSRLPTSGLGSLRGWCEVSRSRSLSPYSILAPALFEDRDSGARDRKKREVLQAEIVSFCASSQILFPDVDLEDYRCFSPPESNPEIEGEDGDVLPATADLGENPFVDVPDPEEVDIPLPSSFADLPSSMRAARRKEIKLRVAQATDALEEIRTEVGRKSYLYRSNIRLADGKKQKTRGYAAVKASNQAMRMAIRIYDQARWALSRLGASTDLLEELKPITKEDTKAITSVYKPNAAGESRTKLSWIWGINVGKDSQNSPYLEERES